MQLIKIGSDGRPLAQPTPTAFLDEQAGLMWMAADLCADKIAPLDAEKRLANFSALGFSDWRIPTRPELDAHVDLSRFNPASSSELNFKPDWYMTSTDVAARRGEFVWGVSFCLGNSGFLIRRYDEAFVRLVRSVAPRQ
ncbi:MAG TPA: DUF1566 domain-containing protein [Burkholderiales bacterium]|nr:DUF1566 domain-containing protein [Burkholderiales bacterium]